MRILIADGDQELRELTRTFLVRRGHDVKAAADGLECADILRDFTLELAVLDCGLLWGGYRGVLALMCHTPRLSRIATILIADEVPHNDAINSSNPMHLGCLRKPFRLHDLLKRIEADRGSLRSAQQDHASSVSASHSGSCRGRFIE